MNIYDITKPLDYKDFIMLRNNLSYPTFSKGFLHDLNKYDIDKFIVVQDCDAYREYIIYCWIDEDGIPHTSKDNWILENIVNNQGLYIENLKDLEDNTIYDFSKYKGTLKYLCKELNPYYYLFTRI